MMSSGEKPVLRRELKKTYHFTILNNLTQLFHRDVKIGGEKFLAHLIEVNLKIIRVGQRFKNEAPNRIAFVRETAAKGFNLHVISHIGIVAEILSVVL